jgi:hypothetical protein
MTSKSNVHPDHYKVAGRNRQGEDIAPEVEKQRYSTVRRRLRRGRQRPNIDRPE